MYIVIYLYILLQKKPCKSCSQGATFLQLLPYLTLCTTIKSDQSIGPLSYPVGPDFVTFFLSRAFLESFPHPILLCNFPLSLPCPLDTRKSHPQFTYIL